MFLIKKKKNKGLISVCIEQVCSSKDISRSSVADASGTPGNRRLLRLKLTDGHSEINAVEYFNVPSIPDDVSPGTKVHLASLVIDLFIYSLL